MKLTIRAIALCSILACATETALADCKNLKFGTLPLTVFWQGGSGPYAGKYNPFNPIAYAQQVEFSVTKNSGECDFFVAFDISAHSGDFNRQLDRQDNRLAYNLYKEASLSTVLKDSNSDAQSVISGHLTAIQNSVQLSYFFNIEPEQLSDNGHFRDSVTIELHPNTFYANSPSTVSKKVDFNATVPNLVDASIVNSGNLFMEGERHRAVNFGLLELADRQDFDLLIRYNKGYKLSFESVNLGVMKIQDGNAMVAYDFFVDGALYNLSNSHGLSIHDQKNPSIEGDRIPLAVVITEQTSSKPNGVYTDTIVGIITAK